MRHHRAILGLCLLLAACDQKPASGPAVHLVATPGCATDWHKCADNAELAREYADWKNIPRLCRQAAEIDPQFGSPQWQDRAFTTVLPGKVYVTEGKVAVAEPNVSFVSTDHALRAKVVCEYDLAQRKVTNLIVLPQSQ